MRIKRGARIYHLHMTKKAFSHIWQAVNELVENGQLISSSEIFEELKDDDIVKWAKEHKDAFCLYQRKYS